MIKTYFSSKFFFTIWKLFLLSIYHTFGMLLIRLSGFKEDLVKMGIPLQTRCENIEWAQIFMIRSSEKIFFIFYILELVYTSREK